MDCDVHEEIAERVLRLHQFSRASITIVRNSNVLQDEIAYNTSKHFDRVPGTNHLEAFGLGIGYFRTELDHTLQDIRKGQTRSALERIDRLFHGIQDFCSHSNFTELPENTQHQIRICFPDSSIIVPMGLKLTGYDPETQSEFPAGD